MECGKNVAFKHSDYKNREEKCYEYKGEDGECAKTTQFGSGYYVNKQIWNSVYPEDNIEKSFLDIWQIDNQTTQDGVTFFEMSDCYGYSGTVHFNDYRESRDPITLWAGRSELKNIEQMKWWSKSHS